MVLSVLVQAQLRRGEHIGLIFVQCWEKTSLHSLGHKGCHCRIAAAGEESQPSESDPRPLAAARQHQQVGVHIFAYFSYLYALHIQVYIFFFGIYSDMNLNMQAYGCAAYFASHKVVTKIYIFSASGSSLHRRRILQRFFLNAGLLLWRHRGLGQSSGLRLDRPFRRPSAKEMSSTRLPRRRQPLRRHQQLLRQQQGRMVPSPPTSIPTPPASEGAEAGAVQQMATYKPGRHRG